MEEKWFANEIQDLFFKAKEKRTSQRTVQGKNAKNNKNQGKANNKKADKTLGSSCAFQCENIM